MDPVTEDDRQLVADVLVATVTRPGDAGLDYAAQLAANHRTNPKFAAINTHARLFDLVRQQRAELHEDGLITDAEYAWLSGGAPQATSKAGGSPSPRRLEDYDDLRAKIVALEEDKAILDFLEHRPVQIENFTRARIKAIMADEPSSFDKLSG